MDTFNYKKSADILALSASMSDFTYKKHAHEEYAVGVTLRGIQQYHLENQFQSSHPGGVMLFNREQSHDGNSYDREGIDYVMLYIKPEQIFDILGKQELRFDQPIVYDSQLASTILQLGESIRLQRDEALSSELLMNLVQRLAKEHIISSVVGSKNRMVQRAKEMMFYNLDHVLKLDDLCKEFGMSKYQFIREFKAQAGISPYQFFLNSKVEQARQAIEQQQSIYAAVADYGFADLTHLNRHFKRMFGITAYEYQLQTMK